MNILVTGGSGTIGGYVLRELLRAGHTASSYSRTAPLVADLWTQRYLKIIEDRGEWPVPGPPPPRKHLVDGYRRP